MTSRARGPTEPEARATMGWYAGDKAPNQDLGPPRTGVFLLPMFPAENLRENHSRIIHA
jgi:hypothetical protein